MRSFIVRVAAAGFAAALAACGSDSSLKPSAGTVDVAALVAATSTTDVAAGSRALVSLPSATSAPAIDPSLCPFSTTNQDFECAAVTRNGLTFKTSYFLLDANGHSLAEPVAATLAAIRAVVDITGTAALPTDNATSLTVNSHSDNTLSGLLADARVLNGSGHEHDSVTTTVGGTTTRAAFDATTSTVNLQIPQAAGAWPASGTISSDVNATTAVGSLPAVSTTAHVVTTFNGTSTVTTMLTVNGHVSTCKLDLSGKAGPACS